MCMYLMAIKISNSRTCHSPSALPSLRESPALYVLWTVLAYSSPGKGWSRSRGKEHSSQPDTPFRRNIVSPNNLIIQMSPKISNVNTFWIVTDFDVVLCLNWPEEKRYPVCGYYLGACLCWDIAVVLRPPHWSVIWVVSQSRQQETGVSALSEQQCASLSEPDPQHLRQLQSCKYLLNLLA